MSFQITTYYKFAALVPHRLEELVKSFHNFADTNTFLGLIIIAPEGINATVAGSVDAINAHKKFLSSQAELEGIEFKDSFSDSMPFKRFVIKERDEIVTLDRTDLVPDSKKTHLSAAEWHKVLENETDFALIDVRNWYEVELGTFPNAIDPKTERFTEFHDFADKLDIPKDKKILMFCTGGIRCEKASLAMLKKGYSNVHQLDGGILKYLEKFPEGKFDGECFVFDHRVAVDSNLKPSSQYDLCSHCGNPGNVRISCNLCEKPGVVCKTCNERIGTCSKNCEHHYQRQLLKENS